MDGLRTADQGGEAKSSRYATVTSTKVGKYRVLNVPAQAVPGRQARSVGDTTVAIARSLDEIESLRPVWREMQRSESAPKPNADMDIYISVLEAGNGRAKPHVILFKRDNRPVAMVIARAEQISLNLKLGYKTLLCPKLKGLNVVYGGILGRPDDEFCPVIVNELIAQLKRREFDTVCFNYLGMDTAFYRAVRETPGLFTRGHMPRVDEHWRMAVPDMIEQFYSARSRGHRRNLRQAVKKFEEKYNGSTSFVKYTREDQVDDFIKVAAEISAKTYQNALGAGLIDDEQTRHRIRRAAKQKYFDGNVLVADGKPCAFQLGLRYEPVYYMVSMGYDPALNSFKAGTVLFLRVLESLCEDSAIHTLDFYYGDAEYKKRYGTEHWPEACVYIFAPRVYPIAVNALQCTVAGINTSLAYLANKIGGTDRIKRTWRDLLGGAPRMGGTKRRSTTAQSTQEA